MYTGLYHRYLGTGQFILNPPPFYQNPLFVCLLSISIAFAFFSVVYDLTDIRKDANTRQDCCLSVRQTVTMLYIPGNDK